MNTSRHWTHLGTLSPPLVVYEQFRTRTVCICPSVHLFRFESVSSLSSGSPSYPFISSPIPSDNSEFCIITNTRSSLFYFLLWVVRKKTNQTKQSHSWFQENSGFFIISFSHFSLVTILPICNSPTDLLLQLAWFLIGHHKNILECLFFTLHFLM